MGEFIVYPAIDLRQGRVVRLAQGDPGRETSYDDDPQRVGIREAMIRSQESDQLVRETQADRLQSERLFAAIRRQYAFGQGRLYRI